VVEQGVPISQAAALFQVSWPTAKRWADRYRDAQLASGGVVRAADLQDRSSRPNPSSTKTPQPVVRKIVHLRWRKRLGPVAIAGQLGMPPSTVYATTPPRTIATGIHGSIRGPAASSAGDG